MDETIAHILKSLLHIIPIKESLIPKIWYFGIIEVHSVMLVKIIALMHFFLAIFIITIPMLIKRVMNGKKAMAQDSL